MDHADHVRLIKEGIGKGEVWVDIGSGEGAFTLALREVAGPGVEIYSIDKDSQSLAIQREQFDRLFPGTNIHYITADFTKPLNLPPLDGILAANSLHYVKDKVPLLKQLKNFLKTGEKLVIVEYNVDTGNTWVPYPFSFQTLQRFALETGFTRPKLLGRIPSSFLREIYSSLLNATKSP